MSTQKGDDAVCGSSEEECAICLEPIEGHPIPNCRGDLYKTVHISCGHVFHQQCIYQCEKCPLCEVPTEWVGLNCVEVLVQRANGTPVEKTPTCTIVRTTESQSGRVNIRDFIYAIQERVCIHRSHFVEFSFEDDTVILHVNI
jgi:hypothetical protein